MTYNDNERYLIKPLPNEDGKRGYRMEIDEFLLDNEMTNLFLIAFEALQKDSLRFFDKDKKKPDYLTFFSLAGIHGQPRDSWNGLQPKKGKDFCHHSVNTFPIWHRPYMMLFEVRVNPLKSSIITNF
jgi:tyrosinase